MPSTAVYIRVSTLGQNEAGQRSQIIKWLKGNGHRKRDVRFYLDKETGTKIHRPALDRLQKDIFDGEIKTVVCWKLDRLSRSLQDGINLLCNWCDRGIRVVSVTQQIDLSGPAGKLVASVLFAVAEIENETRRERQAAGIEEAKKKGKYKGRKPGATKVNPTKAYDLQQKGLSYKEIAIALDIHPTTVYKYLRSEKRKRLIQGAKQ